MSNYSRDVYVLVEGILDEGLTFVASYLETYLETEIIIVDNNGHVHYPEVLSNDLNIEALFIEIPGEAKCKEYCFKEENKVLYYRVAYKGDNAYVVVLNCECHMTFSCLSILRKARLALKCYFSKLNKNKEKFERELREYLRGKSTLSIENILHLSDRQLNKNEKYYIMIINKEDADKEIDWQLLKAYSIELYKQQGYYIVAVQDDKGLVILVPAWHSDFDYLDSDKTSTIPKHIRCFKSKIEERFKQSFTVGIGQIYPLFNLLKSYNQARIAVTMACLNGKTGIIQKFSGLGIYFGIFSQSVESIVDYCWKRIGLLIEYDCKNDGELLLTLRKLLDSCVNIKATADSLFIHVNTLYYRLNKIEQILNIDLSRMDNRVELYTAIKVWDTLNVIGHVYDFDFQDTIKSLGINSISESYNRH